MTITQKIEEINNFVEGSMVITHYVDWEIGSYSHNTLFNYMGDRPKNASFTKAINEAYKIVQKEIKRREE